jgi:D-alanyl-D-alanine carboxypeptidase
LALLLLLAGLVVPFSAAQAKYASIVVDYQSGRVLHQANADTRNYPASLTKMMTLFMVFEALETGRLTLDQKLKVSRRAAGMSPSRLGLGAGQRIKVRDAIQILVTKSANDIAVVVAEAIGGSESEFARMMTQRAQALGMSRTTFRNASGLPNRGQLSTARDMATLAIALQRYYPKYYKYFSTRTFRYQGRSYHNHNRLMKRYKGMDGVKTGYIRASGFNLAASAERGGRRLVAVVFGGRTARSRDSHMAKLLDRGFVKAARLGPGRPDAPPQPKPVLLAGSGATPPAKVAAVSAAPAKVAAVSAAPAKVAAVSAAPALEKAQPAQTQQAATAKVAAPPPNPWRNGENAAQATGNSLQLVSVAAAGEPPPQWAVQVGAFGRSHQAYSAANSAHAKLDRLVSKDQIAISPIARKRGTLYRARLVDLDEGTARQACRELKRQAVDCLVLRQADAG